MIVWALQNPLSTVFLLISLIWSIERMVTSFANRNKIICECHYE